MSGLATLTRLAERRAQQAVLDWQRLDAKCQDARDKLVRLQHHRQIYCELMHKGLRHGMPAAASVGHIGFIAQIEAVVARQQSELAELETACAEHYEALVNARREQRIYELLSEQEKARAAGAVARQQLLESSEMLQRAGRAAPRVSF